MLCSVREVVLEGDASGWKLSGASGACVITAAVSSGSGDQLRRGQTEARFALCAHHTQMGFLEPLSAPWGPLTISRESVSLAELAEPCGAEGGRFCCSCS